MLRKEFNVTIRLEQINDAANSFLNRKLKKDELKILLERFHKYADESIQNAIMELFLFGEAYNDTDENDDFNYDEETNEIISFLTRPETFHYN